MIKYAKIVNNETGLCEVGIGTNEEFYASQGMTKMEVEQSEVDSLWYLSDKCPVKSEEQKLEEAKEAKIQEITLAKEAAFKAGIYFNGAHYDCDDRAQDRTGNRLLLLNAMPVVTLEWLDYDYKPQLFSAQDFQTLCAAIFERIQFIEFKTGQLLQAVENASDIEEVNAIVIDFEQKDNDEEV